MLTQKHDLERQAFSDTLTDSQAVDKFLAKEMLDLSIKDRSDIEEEIHGVKCLAIDETPEMLTRALRQLAHAIDELTPVSQKKAYLKSQQCLTPQLRKLLQLDLSHSGISYVNTSEFRLRFLRCERFHIENSAKRMLKFLDLALGLWGDFVLWRPIRLADFSKQEIKYLKKGQYQILPNRDRSGRRVFTMLAQQECPAIFKAKMLMYVSWTVGIKDLESQRRGCVVVVWYDNNHKRSSSDRHEYTFDDLTSTRVSAVHICSPDTPYFRIRRSIAAMRAGKIRSKLRLHLGEQVELRYALQAYGIPTEDIPMGWTGTIKTKNLVQWMRVRNAIEDMGQTSSHNQIVECPQPYDVLFRKGNAYASHFANDQLRATIEQNSILDLLKRPKQLARDIYLERDRDQRRLSMGNHNVAVPIGRYCCWDVQKGWWYVMDDRDQICLKLEYLIREVRKSSLFLNEKNDYKRKKTFTSGASLHTLGTIDTSSIDTSMKTQTSLSTNDSNKLVLDSATSIFRSQDYYIGMVCHGHCSKKSRIDYSSDFDISCYEHCSSKK